MAASLLLLLDDIASVLDDVAAMTKVAAKKTAGVLGDDLAVNAKQVTGLTADRELPVVWRVALGSLGNKALLVPTALLLSRLLPGAVGPLLMAGGLYLCYEGAEKVCHRLFRRRQVEDHPAPQADGSAMAPRLNTSAAGPSESIKIRGAIRTDFILSAEIIVITLGIVAARPFATQVLVLVAISLLMTVGVYGLVAAIVKLDDLGLWLLGRPATAARTTGRGIVAAAPWLVRMLAVAGTVAMFLVGGGILLHGIPGLHHAIEAVAGKPLPAAIQPVVEQALAAVVGLTAGATAVLLIEAGRIIGGHGRR